MFKQKIRHVAIFVLVCVSRPFFLILRPEMLVYIDALFCHNILQLATCVYYNSYVMNGKVMLDKDTHLTASFSGQNG